MIKETTERLWQKLLPVLGATMRIVERRWWLILIIGALVASALALVIGLAQSVWFDEAYSLTLAKSSVSQLISLTAIDVHPPLYYLLLKAWGSLFGWNDFSYRLLGAIIGGLIVIAGGLLTKRLFGVRATIMTIPFIALAPFLLRYDFEIRMYALASLLGLIATYLLVVAVEAKHRRWLWWALYAVVVAVSMYTVYYIALLWIAHLIWLVYRTHRAKQPLLRQPWVIAYGIALVLFIPWLPTFIGQLTNGALANISQAMTVENLVGIVSFSFLYQSVGQLGAWGAVVMVAVLIALVWTGITAYKSSTKTERVRMALFVVYVVVPVAVITLISLFRPFYVERYLAPVLAGGYLLVGSALAFVSRRKPRQTFVVTIFLITVSIVGVINLAQQGNFNFQRWQRPTVSAATDAIGTCEANQKILAADPYVYIELSQYISTTCDMHFFDESTVLRGGYGPLSGSSQQVKNVADLKDAASISYVYYGDPKLQLLPHFVVTSQNSYGALTVQTWQKTSAE